MVTKEQALTVTRFTHTDTVTGKVYNYRASGKCKVWKRDAERFCLPIKYGLYSSSYIDNTNAHLFEVAP